MQIPRQVEQSQSTDTATEQITVQLDRLSGAALNVLRSGGTSDADAVRAAITDAAERLPTPALHKRPTLIADAMYAERLAVLAASAPPLTEYQRYVLTAALVDGDSAWLSEEQWLAMRSVGHTDLRDARDSENRTSVSQDVEPPISQT